MITMILKPDTMSVGRFCTETAESLDLLYDIDPRTCVSKQLGKTEVEAFLSQCKSKAGYDKLVAKYGKHTDLKLIAMLNEDLEEIVLL